MSEYRWPYDMNCRSQKSDAEWVTLLAQTTRYQAIYVISESNIRLWNIVDIFIHTICYPAHGGKISCWMMVMMMVILNTWHTIIFGVRTFTWYCVRPQHLQCLSTWSPNHCIIWHFIFISYCRAHPCLPRTRHNCSQGSAILVAKINEGRRHDQ